MSVRKQGRSRCLAQLKDGTQCSRFALRSGGDFCHVHSQNFRPSGAAVPRPKPVSHLERLQRFAESRDPAVAMRAISQLVELEGAGVGSATTLPTSDDYRVFRETLAPEESESFAALVKSHKTLRTHLLTKYADVPAVRRVLKG
jgi:hypothetical protein